MEPIARSELEPYVEAYDRAVAADSAIDPFCSGSAWILSYHDAFAPERPLWMAHEGSDWVLLAEQPHPAHGRALWPLEASWGFASPLVGQGAPALLARTLSRPASALCLLGLPLDASRLQPLVERYSGRDGVGRFDTITRYVASLEGGIEGWLSRRSASFRRNLRAAERRVREEGIRFRRVSHFSGALLDSLYQDVLTCERRSWKSRMGSGVDEGQMCRFYEGLWPRLAARGELRLLFAERGDEVVGYLHGGLVGGRFRGLQMSFDDANRRLGLGNILQFEMLGWLVEQGAHAYDLGSYSAYKRRWAEDGLSTFGLFLPA